MGKKTGVTQGKQWWTTTCKDKLEPVSASHCLRGDVSDLLDNLALPLELSMLVQDSEELQKEIGWELEELRAQPLSP